MVVSTDERCSRHRRTNRGGAACPAAAARRVPPPAADPPLALDQRADGLRHADERVDDLQRPPASLLGTVWRELRPSLALVPRPADPRLGDDPFDLQPSRGAPLASGLRLAVVTGANRLSRRQPDQPARPARPRADARGGEA